MNPPNDDFLYTLRQAPDPEFARALQQRLHTSKAKPSHMRRWLSATAVIGVIFAALIMASPEVRAQISQQIERLFYGDVELRVTRYNRIGGEMIPVPIEYLPPAAAQNALAHKTPTWIPAGLMVENDTVTVVYYDNGQVGIGYRWVDADGALIIFLGVQNNAAPQMVIGQGSNSREIEIDGHTGTIYNGAWVDGLWTPKHNTNLVWVEDGVTYLLGSENLSESDLLRMAESFQ